MGDLSERLAGRAHTVVGELRVVAHLRTEVVPAVVRVAQLMQQRALLCKQQQQRKYQRER